MEISPSELGSWLDAAFFNKGAFITNARTQKILLAKGGNLNKSTTIDSTPSFYLKDFFKDEYLRYNPENCILISKEILIETLLPFDCPIEVLETFDQDNTYIEDFNKLKTCWSETLKKVVLLSREEFKLNDPLRARKKFLLKSLLFGAGLPFGIWSETYGVIGSTPEVLFSLEGEELETFALAGTARTGEEEELLNSKKDRLEHDLVTRDIMEKLNFICSDISSDPTTLESFKNIIHLKTNIRAKILPDTDPLELASTLSPTAALGGYPQTDSLDFLTKTKYQNLYPERYFGSCFGYLGPQMKQFLVSIRNIQWRDNTFFIESGGGVLPQSELAKELTEVRLKRDIIKRHYL